jgi:HTH-type transcriptional regulator/antitoxin HigA
MTEIATTFQPDWVSPPGESIADLLEEKSWSQAEFSQRCGYTTKHVSQLINGKAAITEDTAIKLEKVLGSSARFWMTREAQYREAIARAQEFDALEPQSGWLKQLPMNEMVKFGWVRKFNHKGQQVAECLKFFGVASVEAWQKRYAEPIAAFKASNKFEKDGAAVSAWLRCGERTATDIACAPFDKSAFRKVLADLRALTKESAPEKFIPAMVQACASVGVAIVFAPTPKGCPVSGATRWLSPDKALLMLSLRHKTNDHLWFAFFHEAAHLLLHGKKMMFLEVKGLDNKHEQEADQFAKDWLIAPEKAKQLPFIERNYASVNAFADEIGIAPAIVVGRMQNEGYLPWNFLNKFKVRYHWNHYS